jgi:hypothetical protein
LRAIVVCCAVVFFVAVMLWFGLLLVGWLLYILFDMSVGYSVLLLLEQHIGDEVSQSGWAVQGMGWKVDVDGR